MPSSNERQINIKTTTLLKVMAILAVVWFMWLVRDILALLFVALFLAAVMHPAARWGAKHKIPKGLMVIVIYLVFFAVAIVSSALIVPPLVQQIQQVGGISQIIGSSLHVLSSIVETLRSFSEQHGLVGNVTEGLASLVGQLSRAGGGLVETLTALFGGIIGLVIVLVMAFYMVVEDREAISLFHNFMPRSYQEISAAILSQVEEKMGYWLYGQIFLSVFMGILYYVGLLILGVPSPLALALFGAFTEFIPYLGPMLGGIPIIIVALSVSPVKALLVLGFMILMQQLENQILVPKVMQRAVGINPIVSIVAVLVGAKLFGIVGVLLAIPVATALSVALSELYRSRWPRSL